MNRNIFLIVGLAAGIAAATAQTPTNPPADTLRSECLLHTEEQAWVALGLSKDQVSQVRAIQTECKTDCLALDEHQARQGAMSPAILAKHQERVQKVLTKEQYDKWLVWCSERAGHTQLMK